MWRLWVLSGVLLAFADISGCFHDYSAFFVQCFYYHGERFSSVAYQLLFGRR
jgi:hypothetical protein